MLCNVIFLDQLQWRSFEREGAKDAFGEVIDIGSQSPVPKACTAMRWFPPSEDMSPDGHVKMLSQRSGAKGVFHINDPLSYLRMHDKLVAFNLWSYAGFPVPRHFAFGPGEFYVKQEAWNIPYPFLLRLNNSVAGYNSYLVREPSQLEPALSGLLFCYNRDIKAKRGVGTRMFCVEYIDTRPPGADLNVSYRIIVAGNKVVTGYARVSDPSDWVAVTNKFHSGIADAWMEANRRCHVVMEKYHDMLVNAVRKLYLNHQGLDVIEDVKQDKVYLLETQTTYDAGFIGLGNYVPPFFNPYNPELVRFLKENDGMIASDLPLYHQAWLNKREHFRRCYANLREVSGL